jgi:CelD/BcsL family acetyltransferase involved in cellulose biosynthesis
VSSPLTRLADLEVRVVTDTAGFGALEHEWDDLYRHASDAWPHQSWPFLFSWWEWCGGDLPLRLLTLRDPGEGTLVGIVPLMIIRRKRFRTLTFLLDYEPLDVLVREGWERAVEQAVGGALAELPGWDVAELRLRPDARFWGVYDRWHGPREHRAMTDYAFVAAASEDDVLAGLTRKTRKNLFRALRAAEEDGIETRPAPAARAVEAGARLVDLHRELWADRRISTSHASEEWAGFLRAVADRVVRAGLGDVVEWTRDGTVEISQLFLYGPAAVHAYQVGASRYAIDRLQWSSLYIHEGLRIARDRGVPYLDLAYGDEPYKLRWNPRRVPHHRVRLGRGPLGRTFFALTRLQAARRRLGEWRSRRRAAPRSPAPADGA